MGGREKHFSNFRKDFWGPSRTPLTLLKQFLGWNNSPLFQQAGRCSYGVTIRVAPTASSRFSLSISQFWPSLNCSHLFYFLLGQNRGQLTFKDSLPHAWSIQKCLHKTLSRPLINCSWKEGYCVHLKMQAGVKQSEKKDGCLWYEPRLTSRQIFPQPRANRSESFSLCQVGGSCFISQIEERRTRLNGLKMYYVIWRLW